MNVKKTKKRVRPKITLNQVKQIVFTLKNIAKIAYRVRPHMFIGVIVINALWGFSSVPGFYLEKLIVDNLVKSVGTSTIKNSLSFISLLVALYLLLQIVRNILSVFNRLFQRNMSRILDVELHTLVGTKLTELDMDMIESPDYRDRFDRVEREAGRRAWGLMISFSDIPNYLIGFVSALAVLFFVSPFITLILVVASLPKFIYHSKFIKLDYELNKELSPIRRTWGLLSYYLVRNKSYLELKLLNLSETLSEKLKVTVGMMFEKEIALSKKREISGIVSDLPSIIVEMGMSVYLVYLVLIRIITVGTFQLYIQSLRSAQSNLSGLVYSLLEIYENYIYVNDLVWLLGLESRIESNNANLKSVTEVTSFELDNVSFTYPNQKKATLNNINLMVKKGEKIAVVGENGAGKSTLIKLIARFYDPSKGRVLVSGIDLREYSIHSWRKKLAILFQLFELYPFSVKESIGLGDVERKRSPTEIVESAKKAGIHEFVESLPLKYDNPLSPEFDKGTQPSIGQYQRFGIARMLYRKNAEVIILDEPTSNIDPEAEEKIFKEVKKITKDKILFFVTQRFSTVKIADRIIVVDKGRIIEQGTHKELMKLNQKYARLFNLQAEAYLQR